MSATGALDTIVAQDAGADFGTGPVAGRAAIISLMRSFLIPAGRPSTCWAASPSRSRGRAAQRCYVATCT
jgi:hypothetical protein